MRGRAGWHTQIPCAALTELSLEKSLLGSAGGQG